MSPPEIFVNPARRRDLAITPPDSTPLSFHRRLPGYIPSRLVDASNIATDLGLTTVSVKDESERLGLPAFKILGASWAVYRVVVERLGAEPPWDDLNQLRNAIVGIGQLTLVAATDGNHGRAVAHMARLLGFRSEIFVPRGTARSRIDGIAQEDAHVTVIDGSYDDAVVAAAENADRDDVVIVSDTSWDGYADIPRDVIAGYDTIFSEVDSQLATPPDLVVVPMGVGALAAAVVRHCAATATIVVVEPRSAACGLRAAQAGHPVTVLGPHDSIMAGLNCGTVSPVAWEAIENGIDVFVAIDDADAIRAMRDLAMIGVTAGETGAASLAGLRALVETGAAAGRGRNALVLCTEGATDPTGYRRVIGGAQRECSA